MNLSFLVHRSTQADLLEKKINELGKVNGFVEKLDAYYGFFMLKNCFFSETIFSETFEDVSFTKALEKWLGLTNEQESPLVGTQKKWRHPVYVKTAKN